ncbi:MAG: diphthine--ammonia ligase [Candidatus Bathyarchaeia archaeon]|jgi:ABC transporter with metal-binding/Fe-S-binding domain ATP-binding protein
MRVGVLFSGGKDSCLALDKSRSFHDVTCLISLISESQESYMFHVPNIEVTGRQAEAIGLPIVQRRTKGKKERELEDLEKAIGTAKADFDLEGIVTGAVKSMYQSTRVQRICKRLGLWCFNPLWLKDEIELLNELVKGKYEVVISGVFAYPLDEKFLGRKLDSEMIQKLERLRDEYGLSPAGEGGEIETTVIDAPFFKKRLEILDYDVSYKDYSGVFRIKDVRMVDK